MGHKLHITEKVANISVLDEIAIFASTKFEKFGKLFVATHAWSV